MERGKGLREIRLVSLDRGWSFGVLQFCFIVQGYNCVTEMKYSYPAYEEGHRHPLRPKVKSD